MPRILVVDDSKVERRLVGGLLEKVKGYQVDYAENGLVALEKIATDPPEIVLTDLRMPELDGLQLMREIKIRFSALPVILMTAHGSESIALDALRAGAATYVPKEALADSLTDSIARVLSLSQADQAENQLLACLRATNLSFEVENDPELIETLIRVVRRHLKGIDFESESARLQIAVALEQALLNALYRGNLELTEDELEAAREAQLMGGDANQVERRSAEPLYKDRRIYVEIDVAPEKVQFTVRDDGPGFDVDRFADPSPDTIGKAVPGRGILLMKTFMDEVNYNDKGNEVTLIKRSSNGAVRAEGAPV